MSFNELQIMVKDWDKMFGWTQDTPEKTALHMSEELGEVSRQVLVLSGYKSGEKDRQNLGDELCDLLYLTLKLANLNGICLDNAWERIKKRYDKKCER